MSKCTWRDNHQLSRPLGRMRRGVFSWLQSTPTAPDATNLYTLYLFNNSHNSKMYLLLLMLTVLWSLFTWVNGKLFWILLVHVLYIIQLLYSCSPAGILEVFKDKSIYIADAKWGLSKNILNLLDFNPAWFYHTTVTVCKSKLDYSKYCWAAASQVHKFLLQPNKLRLFHRDAQYLLDW